MPSKQETVIDYGLISLYPELKKANQLTIELQAFGRVGVGKGGTVDLGGLTKEEHGKNVVRLAYPWIFQYWNDWLELVLWAWCNYEEIGASGCASSSKTFSFALLGWMEWLAAPMHSAFILTSSTSTSLRSRLWPRIKDLNNKCMQDGRNIPFGFNLVDSLTKIQPVKGDDEHAVQAVAVDAGKVEDAIGKLQGRHPKRMIIAVDEGEQTPEAIFVSRANLRIGTNLYRFCSMANAVNPFSAYGQFTAPKNGWSTVSERDEMWETKTGICLHFHAMNSPNVKAGRVVVPGVVRQEDIDVTIAKHGLNSLQYWMYIAGFPAPSGVRNTVLDAATIFTGEAEKGAVWQSTYEMWGELDPAFTTGGDRCILRLAKIGAFQDGQMGMELLPPIHIKFTESKEYPINYQIVDRVIQECNDRGIPPERFGGDATSASGLFDIFDQRWGRVQRTQFGGAAPDVPVSGTDKRSCRQVYANQVCYLWFSAKELVEMGRLRGLDAETSNELCARQYALKGEKYVLETKAEMKKRTGGTSPDLADPVASICARFRMKFGTHPKMASSITQNNEWEIMAKKFNLHGTKKAYATS